MTILEQPAARPQVRWWHLVVPVVASAASLVAIGFLLGLVSAGTRAPDAVAQDLRSMLENPEIKYVVLQIVMAVIYIALLVALRWLLGPAGRAGMVADFVPSRGKWVLWGAASGLGLAIGVLVITAVLNATGLVTFEESQAERQVMPHSLPELSMAFATIVIIGPYAEELYFRGALLAWLKDKIGLMLAIVIGAALFALAHGQFLTFPGAQGWIATAMLMAVGLVNGVWAANTGSLWPAFSTHAAFNATMVGLSLVAPDSPT